MNNSMAPRMESLRQLTSLSTEPARYAVVSTGIASRHVIGYTDDPEVAVSTAKALQSHLVPCEEIAARIADGRWNG